jgi:hypothetical protein
MTSLREQPTAAASRRRQDTVPNVSVERSRWIAGGLVAIVVGLSTLALLGPLVSGVIDYRVTETLRNQTIGLDFVSLLVVAPLALLAAFLAARRDGAGLALALAIGAYSGYLLVQYVLGPDYAHLPGNNERLFPLALALFVAGWAIALSVWNTIDVDALPLSPRRAWWLTRVILPVLALAAFCRYVPALIDWMSSSPTDEVYLAGPTFGWAIALLDLGVFMPLTICACVGLARGHRSGIKPSTPSSVGSGWSDPPLPRWRSR